MELYRHVSHTTQEALALPPKYLRMYGDFVTKNASAVSQIEGALRYCLLCSQANIVLMASGRFRDTEIASESCKQNEQSVPRPPELNLSHSTLERTTAFDIP
ncbi:hypothetical protein D6C98_06655 [Aureobasidium pullulans]|nr:hypothetical protein D6C98_06655 [Aureobasidium pullulans]TIA27046.1 hypothetical protein D6C81_00224 [Aureobasidium pullulans]